VAFALTLLLVSSAAASEREPIRLAPGSDPGTLSTAIWWLEDPAGDWSLDESRRRAGAFRRNEGAIFNPGVSTSVIWVRLDVANAGAEAGEWVISLNRSLVDLGEIHLVRAGRAEMLLGGARPASFEDSYRRFGTLAARFGLEPGGSAEIYVRYRGANWSALSPTLHDAGAFETARGRELAIFLLLLGGVGTLLLYGCVSFAFASVRIVLLYAIAQVGLFAFYAHMTGFTTMYLWPSTPQIGRVFGPISLMTFVVAMAQFARLFFETAQRARIVDRVLLVGICMGLAAIVTSPLDYVLPSLDRRIPLLLAYAAAVLVWIVMPILSVHATWRWHRDFWPLAVAWVSMAIFMITMQLILLGVVNTMPLGKQSYGFVVYTEAFFVALAIALRIRTLKVEAVTAQQRLAESLRAQLAESLRAMQLAEEREWALQDLAEKGRLLLAAGHDTRQTLGALRSYAVGLRLGADDADVAQASRDIEQIANTLNDILTSAVEGSRSGGISDEALALDTLTASSVLAPLDLIHGQTARRQGLDLRIRRSERLLVTDRVLVVRVLGNLVSNAVKYTADGRILVSCRPYRGGHRFQVFDTGPGVGAEALARLLDPRTGALRLQDREEGVGAGFGIAHALAARLGGRIAGRSLPGKGSVFELILPGLPARPHPRQVILLDADREQSRQIERLVSELEVVLESADTLESVHRLIASGGSAGRVLLVDQFFGASAAGRGRRGDGRGEGDREGLAAVRDLASAHGVAVAVLTYDRSAEARADLARIGDLLLYRPVSGMALRAALSRMGGAPSGGEAGPVGPGAY
jgi:signal transduction histidine kinase